MNHTDPIFQEIETDLTEKGFEFERKDMNRPWGGFWVIKEDQIEQFLQHFFPNLTLSKATKGQKVSPKILLVAPQKRLSWQYHFRRSEIWKVIKGPVGISRSDTDEMVSPDTYSAGDVVTLKKGERHRLIGLEDWGIVAEIWQHTDPDHPSDENDIVRLQDDFARKSPTA